MRADYNKPNDILEGNKYRGQFKVEKKTLAQRAINFLFSDKIDSIGNYLVYDIIGPTFRDLIYKSFVGAIGMAIYGSVTNPGNPLEQKYAGARRDYSAMSRPGPGQFNVQTPMQPQYGYGIYDITFDTKDIALYYLDRLQAYIAKYGNSLNSEESRITDISDGEQKFRKCLPTLYRKIKELVDEETTIELKSLRSLTTRSAYNMMGGNGRYYAIPYEIVLNNGFTKISVKFDYMTHEGDVRISKPFIYEESEYNLAEFVTLLKQKISRIF